MNKELFQLSNIEPQRTGILLINTGSPSSCESRDVAEYLRHFLMDSHIVPMPTPLWRIILNAFILPTRKNTSARKYSKIWTPNGSPLLATSKSLAVNLQDYLNRKSKAVVASQSCTKDIQYLIDQTCIAGQTSLSKQTSIASQEYTPNKTSLRKNSCTPKNASKMHKQYIVKSAIIYGERSINEAIQSLKNEDCKRIVACPMYPQSAYSTTKAAFAALEQAQKETADTLQVARIENYFDNDLYINAIAQTVLNAGFGSMGDALLMAFHSIPLRDVSKGDTYIMQSKATSNRLRNTLQNFVNTPEELTYKMCFLSRFKDGRKWASPFIEDVIKRLTSGNRATRIFIVCPNFAIDNLETLYDINIKLRKQIESGCQLIYVPCLNDSSQHVQLLADIIQNSTT